MKGSVPFPPGLRSAGEQSPILKTLSKKKTTEEKPLLQLKQTPSWYFCRELANMYAPAKVDGGDTFRWKFNTTKMAA